MRLVVCLATLRGHCRALPRAAIVRHDICFREGYHGCVEYGRGFFSMWELAYLKVCLGCACRLVSLMMMMMPGNAPRDFFSISGRNFGLMPPGRGAPLFLDQLNVGVALRSDISNMEFVSQDMGTNSCTSVHIEPIFNPRENWLFHISRSHRDKGISYLNGISRVTMN
jgi:hypothetical protein